MSKHEGGCLCGAVRYSFDVTPAMSFIKTGTLDDPSWVKPGVEGLVRLEAAIRMGGPAPPFQVGSGAPLTGSDAGTAGAMGDGATGSDELASTPPTAVPFCIQNHCSNALELPPPE
ncbi:MAG: hypothetical protein R3E83_16220 [Burkholderiaceae bacterium]